MHLSELIKSRKFAITCEIDSPKGVSVDEFLDKVNLVKNHVDAINVGDNQRAVMRAASLAVCRLLKEGDIEPIMEVAARYRNRLAIQSDLLGAAILGIENILLVAGFDPMVGDHTEAQAVHDLDAVSLVNAAVTMAKGTDMTGHALNEAPHFCLGIMATPELESEGMYLGEIKEKLALGVQYIQTQPVYEPETLERFMDLIGSYNVPVLVGHVMLKSASMARFMNSNFPGVMVPEKMIKELEGLRRDQVVETSLQISVELLKKMKPMCQGIHFMPTGWETYVPRIVEEVVGERV
jgi:5,10-methylenetetrahydrofolate reductase